MSGKKTKTIDEREYYKLINAVRQLDAALRREEAERRAKEQAERDLNIAKRYNKDIEDRMSKISKNLDAAKNEASVIKKQLIDTVNNTNKALKAQSDRFDSKLLKLGKDFADEMDKNNLRIEKIIDDNTKMLKGDIAKLQAETQTAIADVKKDISALAKKVGDPDALVDAGKDYYSVALELIAQLENSRQNMFYPGELNSVKDSVLKAKKYIDGAIGNPALASNAILLGEEAFEKAHKLYQDVANAEILWKSKLAVALEALTAAQNEIKVREKVVLEDVEGKKRDFDTDFWSDGSITALNDQIEKLRVTLQVEDKAKELTFDELDGIAVLAKDIIDDTEQVRTGAVLAILNSQERIDLAEELVCELADTLGLAEIKAEGYEGKDMRAANLLHLKNGSTGFEVIITLKPDFSKGNSGYLAETDIINPGDNSDDAETFDAVLREVMRDYGLSGVGEIPVNPEKKDDVRNWEDKDKAATVSTVATNPAIKQKAEKLTRTAKN